MIGQALGHYRVLGELGSGGMGVVYRALDLKLGREVALKFLLQDSTPDATGRARLLREARTASALNHPHIGTIFEVGEQDGTVWIAMELVEGRALSELVGDSGMTWVDVLRCGIQITDALDHAHERGVIHRDLKSANVMMTKEGRTKILDFGLARRISEHQSPLDMSSGPPLTPAGAVVGTPYYMAPEVVRGGDADPRSDLWALGVLLYEVSSGSLPFPGRSALDVAVAVLHNAPPPLPPRVPPSLQAIITKCLEKDPAARYQQARDVRRALQVVSAEGPSSTTVAPSRPAPTGRSLRATLRRKWILIAAITAVIAALAVFNPGGWRERLFVGRPSVASIAVLPFTDLSGDPAQAYFVDGMTEELTSALAQISAIRVISRSSTMGLRSRNLTLRDIRRILRVDAVIEGSVLRVNDRVRIHVRLVSTATENYLWEDSYDRELRDVLAVQADVARSVAVEIQASVSTHEHARLTSRRAVDPVAHELYLEGLFYWNRRTDPDLRKAITYFQRAVTQDSSFGLAHAGLALSYGLLPDYGLEPKDRVMPIARDAARRALRFDSTLSQAHAALGNVDKSWTRDWMAAERHYRRAIELNPSYATAHHWYGVLLVWMGRVPAAVSEMERARMLDPLSPIIRLTLGRTYYLIRNFDGAVDEYAKTVELDPTRASGHAGLAGALFQKGRFREAAIEWALACSLQGVPGRSEAGPVVTARDYLNRRLLDTRELFSAGRASTSEVGAAESAMGNVDRAFAWLERGLRDQSLTIGDLDALPEYDALRADPRYSDLMAGLRRSP